MYLCVLACCVCRTKKKHTKACVAHVVLCWMLFVLLCSSNDQHIRNQSLTSALFLSSAEHHSHRRCRRGHYAFGGMQLGSLCKWYIIENVRNTMRLLHIIVSPFRPPSIGCCRRTTMCRPKWPAWRRQCRLQPTKTHIGPMATTTTCWTIWTAYRSRLSICPPAAVRGIFTARVSFLWGDDGDDESFAMNRKIHNIETTRVIVDDATNEQTRKCDAASTQFLLNIYFNFMFRHIFVYIEYSYTIIFYRVLNSFVLCLLLAAWIVRIIRFRSNRPCFFDNLLTMRKWDTTFILPRT